MKKRKSLIVISLVTGLTLSTALISYAGTWHQDNKGWWYQNDNGSYPKSSWQTIDGKSYYFNEHGYMLSDTTSPDGYSLMSDGSWDGKNIEKKPEIEESKPAETETTKESQPSTEAQTETVKETVAETTVHQTEAPTTVAETKAPETKAPETTVAATQAPKTNYGIWNVSGETVSDVMAKGNELINVYENRAEYNYGDITISKAGSEYSVTIGVRLTTSGSQNGLKQLLRLTGGNSGELYNALYQSFEGEGSPINYDSFVDVAGHKIKATNNGNSIIYTIK